MPARNPTGRRAQLASRRNEVFAAILGNAWGITPQGLELVLARAEQALSAPAAVDAKPSDSVERSWQLTKRDGVAQLRLYGPLVSADSWMTWYFTSYQDIARELHTALSDASITALVLTFSSPGGHVNGCQELAEIITAARGTKPIVAYVEGDACSAAYWLASACDEIVAARTAVLGCLGVQVAYLDMSKALESWGLREITVTSSQTPEKNRPPLDDEGRVAWQLMVDDLADVFLTTVAENRGVDRAAVDAQFGRGAVLVAGRAIAAGMVDRIGTYESLHAELASGTYAAPRSSPGAVIAGAHSPTPTITMPTGKIAKGAKAGAKGSAKPAPAKTGAKAAAAAEAPKDDEETPDATSDEGDEGEDDDEASAEGEGTDDEDDDEEATPTASALKAERARVNGILALASKAPLATLQQFIENGSSAEKAAHALLTGAVKGARSSALGRLAGDEAAIAGKQLSTTTDAPAATHANPLVEAMRATNPRGLVTSAHGVRMSSTT